MNSITFKIKKCFTITNYRHFKRAEYTLEPILNLYAKKFRKMALDNSLLEKSKMIIPSLRLRKMDDNDGLISLKKRGECAGVILKRDNFEEIDFVLQQKQGFTIRRKKNSNLQKYHVQIPDYNNGELIPVTMSSMKMNPVENWISNIYFNRYVVGSPNLLQIPIEVRMFFQNKSFNNGSEYIVKMENVWVYSYNEDYPTRFLVDPTNVTSSRGYKLGDLVNTFPDGIVIHPKYKNLLNRNIFTVFENDESRLMKKSKEEQIAFLKQKGIIEVDEEEEELEQEKKRKEKEEKAILREKEKEGIREVNLDKKISEETDNSEFALLKALRNKPKVKEEKVDKKQKNFISFKKKIMQDTSIKVKAEFKKDDGKDKKKTEKPPAS